MCVCVCGAILQRGEKNTIIKPKIETVTTCGEDKMLIGRGDEATVEYDPQQRHRDGERLYHRRAWRKKGVTRNRRELLLRVSLESEIEKGSLKRIVRKHQHNNNSGME